MNDHCYLDHLVLAQQQGSKFKYIYFWGHTPKDQNIVDKSCFSQWYPSAFESDGIHYATAEHYMMAQKARLFHDDVIFEKILQAEHPNQAKELGRLVKNYDEKIWLKHRFQIVVQGNIAKFSQHAALKDFLLATGDQILVEASPVDKIWGIGLAQDHEKAQYPEQWQGLNLLGFALMQARAVLK
ncbi:NADAR family protein [Acinetobacter sp. ANC 3791]|uniref:NADAR family protein n=1 Tax=Acinetobacter sp. ANC 3791 TaxID=2529836 RepID=UPI001040605A|nr:NADAR family protein [Acinetobacter sp. ANC 3791]TCB83854.1 NADAR family protein [Acinetobacter sp. ANC 3791]